jgi:nucleoid-associated protein YejK
MGRQAKLKKMRQQAKENSSTESSKSLEETDPKNFVKNFEQQGYKLTESLPCPEIPDKDTKPQL